MVDDDFRVAGIHATRVARVDGFECVGQVYSAAAAREAIARLNPDLLLLDVHLPDEDGISLLRSLQAAGTEVDCIIITAAQDLATVTSAMSSGAVYYLVKPFSFERLRTQLEAYRKWRQELESASTANQATIDSLYNARSAGPGPPPGATPAAHHAKNARRRPRRGRSRQRRRDRRAARRQPPDGAALPQCAGTQRPSHPGPHVRHHRQAAELLHRALAARGTTPVGAAKEGLGRLLWRATSPPPFPPGLTRN
ncbi:probable C4-dicarboxylate response regulator DctR [Arthrobacter sp. Hiyo8]|nr:probable C4-dicarboxylate response regulator DctR [Arthrobacter sp. Hiyo8]